MEFLTFIGAVTVAAAIVIIFISIFGWIFTSIDKKINQYKIKHRFDKPPLAKCYCIDCKYRNKESRYCYRFYRSPGRRVADDWFCYEATPREKDNGF